MKSSYLKKKLSELMILGLIGASVLTAIPAPTFAVDTTGTIVVNGVTLNFDDNRGYPVSVEGRMHVSIRMMADALGYKTQWDAK